MKRLLAVLLFLCYQVLSLHHRCHHDKLNLSLQIEEDEHEISSQLARALQEDDYQNIRIYVDFSRKFFIYSFSYSQVLENSTSPSIKDYIQNDLLPSAVLYYQQTLKVIPRSKNITSPWSTICGLPAPQSLIDGVKADVVIVVDASAEDSEYVAHARACSIGGPDQRPIIGNVHFNLNYLKFKSQKDRDENLIVTLHEMAHVFGISKGLFDYFYNVETGEKRTGHIKQKLVNGVDSVLIDVEPLTSKLKDFYGCPNIEGALLENQGDVASTNSHFERRVFFDEIMTAGEIEGARISDFMLAFLEGSGWYKGNYSMTEPVFWGKGRGCDFYYGSCMKAGNPPKSNFEEFCSDLAEVGCSVTRRYAASCGNTHKKKENLTINSFNYWEDGTVVSDMFSDNCPYFVSNVEKDCEDSSYQGEAFLKEEVFGIGSKCFTGNIADSPQGSGKKKAYCLKASCEKQADSNFVMNIRLGDLTAVCKTSGPMTIEGYNGEIDCPDPNNFCNTFGSSFCEKGCMGRGQCINNRCVCNDGWGGPDCNTKIFLDNCRRCANNEIKTTCYGDACQEPPSVVSDSVAVANRAWAEKGLNIFLVIALAVAILL